MRLRIRAKRANGDQFFSLFREQPICLGQFRVTHLELGISGGAREAIKFGCLGQMLRNRTHGDA